MKNSWMPDRNVKATSSAVKPSGVRPSDDANVDGVEREDRREQDADRAEHGRGAQRRDRERQESVEGELRQPAQRVPRTPGPAFVPLDVDPDLPKADPGAQAAQVALPLRQGVDGIHHPPRQQREVAGVERQVDVRRPRDQPVRQRVCRAQEEAFLPPHAARVHDLVPLLIAFDELGNGFGCVLKVAVHQHDHVTAHVRQRGAERRLMTEVSRQDDDANAGIVLGRGIEKLHRAIAAAIVDKQQLVRPAGNRRQHCAYALQQLRHHGFLVEHRNRDGKSHQVFTLPRK